MIYFIGTGLNSEENLSQRAVEIIKKADMIIGFKHSLETPRRLNDTCEFRELEIYDSLKPERIDQLLKEMKLRNNSVICVGGSPVFFSYVKKIASRLDKEDFEFVISPSSVEYLAERHKTDLNDLCIVSGHNSHDLVHTRTLTIKLLSTGRKVGYFVKNEDDLRSLLKILAHYKIKIHAGFELGTSKEKILEINPNENFDYVHGRWILLLIPEDSFETPSPFPKNEQLETKNIPVSREWSRSLVIHEMELESADIVWDLGAGSGATSIWISGILASNSKKSSGRVYAVEKDENRFEKLCKNTKKYPNIIPVGGDYSQIIETLPKPDRILFGGGIDQDRLEKVFSLLPSGTKFVSPLTTVDSVVTLKKMKGIEVSCEMYTKSCSRELGDKTAFVGEHVFYLMKGEKI